MVTSSRSFRPPGSPAALQSFSLSRGHNPNFRQLLHAISDPNAKAPITVVVGAGASVDSGMPAWDALVQKITSRLKNEHARNLALTDDSDGILRKSEYVLEMVLSERGRGTQEELVRDALYGASIETVPGQLANAIASLVVDSGARVRLATTNFDDVLETALGLTSKRTVTPFVLEDAAKWRRHRGLSVLHLHGRLPRAASAEGNLILTESSFLKYGLAVREVLTDCIREGPVVFIGLSVTDPNLVGPLWDTKGEGRFPRFALHVPPVLKEAAALAVGAADEAYETIDISRSYGVAKYSFVEEKLRLKPLYLKSYGQMTQALIEMRIAVKEPRRYLHGRSAAAGLAYGYRLTRLLNTAYESIGCKAPGDAPSPDAAFALNKLLREKLESGSPLMELIDRFRTAQRKELRAKIDEYGSGYPLPPPLDDEHFALFLWLRSRESDPDEARYAINLVGASPIAHADPYALRQNEPISPLSQYAMAKSLFTGNALRVNLDVKQNPVAWRGIMCVPVRAWETGSPLDTAALVTVGGISLNTSHFIQPEVVESKIRPVSLISVLNGAQRRDFQSELEALAREILGLGRSSAS